ncbi:MAG: Holliday junction branch migration protein RuvA [Clostridia bacterium]|nr:Holliday junction branch migration protein RuvA [Clostridia bacterium]
MISYLFGKVVEKHESSAVIDVNDIGYNVSMPSGDVAQLTNGETVKVNTYFYVRDGQPELYGFLIKESLNYFNKLIQISGVGPKAAISVLSALAPQDLALAIISEDVKAITRAQGVGTKMAQRIILELKGKIDTQEAVFPGENSSINITAKNVFKPETEAVNALIALGASPSVAQKTVMQIAKEGMETEDIIKEALRRMSNGI